jgi:hypothetical protein
MRIQKHVHKEAWKVLWGFCVPTLLLAAMLVPAPAVAQETASAPAVTDAQDSDMTARNFREKNYYYKAFNHRDPFQSLISGEFEQTEFELVDIYSVRLVGILSGEMEKFAMLEDNNGYGYILRAGDPIRHGSVVSVGDLSLIARVTMYGQTSSVTLRMVEGTKGKGE